MTADIATRVRGLIAEALLVDVTKVTDEAHLMLILGADSLDLVEIIMGVEEEFNIEVEDSYLDAFDTPADIIKFVKERVQP